MLKNVTAKGQTLTVSNVTTTSADLTFGTGSGYSYGLTYNDGATTTAATAPTASPYTLSGLASATTYTATLTGTRSGFPTTTLTSKSFTTPGTVPTLNSSVLRRWLLTTDNSDDAPNRSPNVTASTPTLINMSAADGSTAGVIANSATYGQATAPNADSTSWNGTIITSKYEEFTTTAVNGQLRLDSLIVNSAFYNTANGKLAVAYSTDGFATAGTYILGTAAAPVAVNNQGTGFSLFRLPLTAGTSGVTLTNGQLITFRFYFALGTASSRYALLKTVAVKGQASPSCTSPTGFAVSNIGSSSATMSFTAGLGNTGFVMTYTPAGGSAATVTPAPTASPVVLSGLMPATSYTVTLQSTCAAGQGAVLSTTFTTRNVSVQLQQWPLQADMQDNAGTRSAAVVASPASLRRLQLANGSVASVPAYSTTNGQGLAPTPAGTWSTSASTPAPENVQTVNRKYYEQFAVTAASGYNVRLDSLILSAAGDGSANGRLAVVYSRSNFVSDSTDIAAGGKVVPGGALPGTGYGAFASVISLPNQTGGLSTVYHLPLATSSSIALAPGQTLTIRVYAGIGSTGVGRYLLLRDVQVLGQGSALPLPVTLTRFEAGRQGRQAVLTWATASEHNSKGVAVQASADGREFRTIGFVPSSNANSAQAQSYRFLTAQEGLAGTWYYRLEQVDLDGANTFTAPRSVAFDGLATSTISASPNPFTNELTLATQAAAAATVPLLITDATGRTVFSQLLEVPAGPAKPRIAGLDSLPKGLYMLYLFLDGRPEYVKLVKE